MFNNPIRMVRELKGAPLSIFLALAYQRTRVSQGWLCGATGYTDKPVQQALAYMAEIGIINHTRAGWQLTRPDAVQLPLAPVEISATTTETTENTEIFAEKPENNPDTNGGSRNNSDSLLVSLVNIDSINQEDLTKLTNNSENRKNSAVWEILEGLGVKRNRATEAIADLEWVESGYLNGLVEKLEGEGRTWPKDCGLLLYRLKQKPAAMRHGKDCRCEACDAKRRARYAER
jgi:hypothetical protein